MVIGLHERPLVFSSLLEPPVKGWTPPENSKGVVVLTKFELGPHLHYCYSPQWQHLYHVLCHTRYQTVAMASAHNANFSETVPLLQPSFIGSYPVIFKSFLLKQCCVSNILFLPLHATTFMYVLFPSLIFKRNYHAGARIQSL